MALSYLNIIIIIVRIMNSPPITLYINKSENNSGSMDRLTGGAQLGAIRNYIKGWFICKYSQKHISAFTYN